MNGQVDAQEVINYLTERIGQMELEKAILKSQLQKALERAEQAEARGDG